MASTKRPTKVAKRRGRPATTPEARENELVSLAYDVAEEQMRNGTASSQVITQFLKLGSSREKLEQERLRHENELSVVKRQAIESQQRVEEMYSQALSAMREYSGLQPNEVDDDPEDVY